MENQVKLCKAFVEARHEKNIDLSENMSKLNTITKMFKKEFLQNNMDLTNNLYLLLNPVKRYSCIIDPFRIIVDYDDPSSVNVFKNIATNIFKETPKTLGIEKFSRVGLRTLWGINYDSLDEINLKIREKFIKITDDQIKLFGDCPDNFHCGFNVSYQNYKINLNFAPASFQNINIQNNVVKENSVTSYALFDIDFYFDQDLEISEFNKFMFDAVAESEKRALAYSKMI